MIAFFFRLSFEDLAWKLRYCSSSLYVGRNQSFAFATVVYAELQYSNIVWT
uniref:Uncharacterized protein n=1 Tax=Arundo donax TaxID=35708 RepID=A0A0A9GS68_ARUDO